MATSGEQSGKGQMEIPWHFSLSLHTEIALRQQAVLHP
jgi:hypothetical protein